MTASSPKATWGKKWARLYIGEVSEGQGWGSEGTDVNSGSGGSGLHTHERTCYTK